MQLTTIVVTRNLSISVKTMHSLLRLNVLCLTKNIANELVMVKDDPFEKLDMLLKKSKHCDRLIWLDYSVHMDDASLEKATSKFPGSCHMMVFPCVAETIDWELFKKKAREGSTEPVNQMGLNFDTEVTGKPVETDVYAVKKTNPRCWAMETKPTFRLLKDKKGDQVPLSPKPAEFFQRLLDRGVKIMAFTAASLTATYSHECLGNIIETAGVKVTP